jgi:hypothetical protein
METSEQVNELFAALSVAQGKIETVKKSAENTFFKKPGSDKGSAYATLADCVKATHGPLSENKLCLIQGVHCGEFVARLAHASGQWLQVRIPIPGDLSKMNAQQLGSATTYLRRQTYSLVGLAPDEDDDGNEAAKAGNFKKPEAKGNGIGVHSPKQDVSEVPADLIDGYVVQMGLIASLDLTDEQLNEKIYGLHHDLNVKNREVDGIYQASVDAMIAKKYITSTNAWRKAVAAHKSTMNPRAA